MTLRSVIYHASDRSFPLIGPTCSPNLKKFAFAFGISHTLDPFFFVLPARNSSAKCTGSLADFGSVLIRRAFVSTLNYIIYYVVQLINASETQTSA